jgi:dihydroxyacetone kinase DhaKLM complex PTS-EIIA-like component DhaM
MTTITYLTQGTVTKIYNTEVSSYISSRLNIRTITDISSQLGISETAIAGAMAEENDGYLDKKLLNDAMDFIAQHAMTFTDIGSISEATTIGMVAEAISNGVAGRSHEEWVASYNAYKVLGWDTTTFDNWAYKLEIKLQFPVLIDLGLANFRMETAIRLLNEPELQTYVSTLELSTYKNDYAALEEIVDRPRFTI